MTINITTILGILLMMALLFISAYMVRSSSIEEEEEMSKFDFDVPKQHKERKSFIEELRKIRENDTRQSDSNLKSFEKSVMGEPKAFEVDKALSEAIEKQNRELERRAKVSFLDKALDKVGGFLFSKNKEDWDSDEPKEFSVDEDLARSAQKLNTKKETEKLSPKEKMELWFANTSMDRKNHAIKKMHVRTVVKLVEEKDEDELFMYSTLNVLPLEAVTLIRRELPTFFDENKELFDYPFDMEDFVPSG